MKLFVDTANLEELEQCLRRGFPSGVTTNPSILSKEQRRDFRVQAGQQTRRRRIVICGGGRHVPGKECLDALALQPARRAAAAAIRLDPELLERFLIVMVELSVDRVRRHSHAVGAERNLVERFFAEITRIKQLIDLARGPVTSLTSSSTAPW